MSEQSVGLEIKILANLIGRYLNVNCGIDNINLTGPQGLILSYLYECKEQDIFQRDIEIAFNIRRSSVTGLLQGLESNGFIKRINVARDARLKKIILTDKAYEFQEALQECIGELESTLIKGLEPEEISQLITLINKMKNNLV